MVVKNKVAIKGSKECLVFSTTVEKFTFLHEWREQMWNYLLADLPTDSSVLYGCD
jgi:hypothetical protein